MKQEIKFPNSYNQCPSFCKSRIVPYWESACLDLIKYLETQEN